jgi:filamentous hemagglutinin family protein
MKIIIKLSAYFTLLVTISSYAEVVTDGSVGDVRSLSGQMLIPQKLGTTVGNNLFHSFKTFNINSGETATFKAVDTIKNVISRVTGGNISTLDGLLTSEVGNANFYFINPAGVTFGQNAEINVPAAFHVSTANTLWFADGNQFNAIDTTASTFSVAEPASFGFLGTSSNNNGLIQVNGTFLAVKPEKTLDLVAGNISIENNATLSASAGEIRLVAMQGTGEVGLLKNSNGTLSLPTDAPSITNAGNISIHDSTITSDGDGGGRIALWSGKTFFTNANLYADNSGNTDATPAKGVDLRAYSLNLDNSIISFDTYNFDPDNIIGNSANANVTVETTNALKIVNGGSIKAGTYTNGNAGNVKVTASALTIDSQNSSKTTGIYSQANVALNDKSNNVKGNGGNVTVNAKTVDIFNGGVVFSSTATKGNAGDVMVNADNLTIDGESTKSTTGIFSDANADSNGNAGNVNVNNGTLAIVNNGSISSTTYAEGNAGTVSIETATLDLKNDGQISSLTFAKGNAGNVNVSTDTLTITGQNSSAITTGIFSQAEADTGNAGHVAVQAKTIELSSGGQVSSSTFSEGDAGNLTVIADNLTIEGESSGVFSQANSNSSGNAGNVAIETGNLDIRNGGIISSSTYAKGKGGDILVNTDSLTINGQALSSSNTGIFSQANRNSVGKAGNVTIAAQKINLINAGAISSSTAGQGNSGDVLVTADNLTIDGQFFLKKPTGIFSQTDLGDIGNAGSVTVKADRIDISRGGVVSSSTFGSGNADDVIVQAKQLSLDSNSKISALAAKGSSGKTGNIAVTASKSLQLSNQSKITIQNDAELDNPSNIKAGTIIISAPDIALDNDGLITAESTGKVDAGNIIINFSHQLAMMDNSQIKTTATDGNGGNITINGGELINLQNSGFLTSVNGANGNGGNINVAADLVVMNTGVIQANAIAGKGGDIGLNLKGLIPSYDILIKGGSQVQWRPYIAGFNVIQAASTTGVSGNINLTSPQFNISGVISGLTANAMVLPDMNRNPCQNSTLGSSLMRKSKGGLPTTDKQAVFFPPAIIPTSQATPTTELSNLSQNSTNQPCVAL